MQARAVAGHMQRMTYTNLAKLGPWANSAKITPVAIAHGRHCSKPGLLPLCAVSSTPKRMRTDSKKYVNGAEKDGTRATAEQKVDQVGIDGPGVNAERDARYEHVLFLAGFSTTP